MVKNAVGWDMRNNRIDTKPPILLKKGAREVKETRRSIIQSCDIRAARGSGL